MTARPTVADLSDRYANFMVNPAPAGPGICDVCWTFCGRYKTCHACSRQPQNLDVVVPVSYSVNLGQMHTALRGYKDGWDGNGSDRLRNGFTSELAAVLSRFLAEHEACVSAAAGTPTFTIVANVPSATAEREDSHWRLRWMLEKGCRQTVGRFERLLAPTLLAAHGKAYDPGRYVSSRPLAGESVLLVDDTWTQGRSAQSAAYALKAAGAGPVALVVLGRHIDPDWEPDHGSGTTCGDLLKTASPWSWKTCALAH